MPFETKEKPAKMSPPYIHDMADTIPTEGMLPGVSGRDGGVVKCESGTATVERGMPGRTGSLRPTTSASDVDTSPPDEYVSVPRVSRS